MLSNKGEGSCTESRIGNCVKKPSLGSSGKMTIYTNINNIYIYINIV